MHTSAYHRLLVFCLSKLGRRLLLHRLILM